MAADDTAAAADPIDSAIAQLVAQIRRSLADQALPEAAQRVLAEVAELLPDLERLNDRDLIRHASLVMAAALSPQDGTAFAERLLGHLKDRVQAYSRWWSFHPVTPPHAIAMGISLFLYVVFVLAWLRGEHFLAETFAGVPLPLHQFVFVGIWGAVGSIVSMLIRIIEFEQMRRATPALLVFTGFLRPVIGMTFAAVIWAALLSQMVPITLPHGEVLSAFLVVIGFIAGFSERLAPTLLSKAEQHLEAA